MSISRLLILLLNTPFSGLLPIFGFVLKLFGREYYFVTIFYFGQIEIAVVLAALRAIEPD